MHGHRIYGCIQLYYLYRKCSVVASEIQRNAQESVYTRVCIHKSLYTQLLQSRTQSNACTWYVYSCSLYIGAWHSMPHRQAIFWISLTTTVHVYAYVRRKPSRITLTSPQLYTLTAWASTPQWSFWISSHVGKSRYCYVAFKSKVTSKTSATI